MPQPSRPLPMLALTCGDPAGIGPEVVLAAWQATAAHERARLRVVATADMLEDDLITAPFEVVDGRMRAPGGSGAGALGVMLDLEAVGRYRVDVA